MLDLLSAESDLDDEAERGARGEVICCLSDRGVEEPESG